MRTTHDKGTRAIYVYLDETAKYAAQTIDVSIPGVEVFVDKDKDGNVIGVEILYPGR